MSKKINKLMSLLVAMVMLVSMVSVVNVSAADKGMIDELYDDYADGASVGYSNDKAYAGKRSIHIKSAPSKSVWLGAKADLCIVRGNSYDVEVYLYPVSVSTGQMYISIDGGVRTVFKYDGTNLTGSNSTYTIEKADKEGWWKVSTSNTTAAGTWDPQLFIAENGFECYVDMLTVKDASKSAPNFSSSFEEAVYPDARVDYMPKNFIATQVSGSQISVSWRNPKAPAITDVKLYNAETDELLSDSLATTADDLVEYLDTSFEAETEKVYSVEFTFADGVVKSYVTGITPGSSYDYAIGNWTLGSSSNPKPPAKIYVDDNVYKTDAPSIRVVSNYTGALHATNLWLAFKTTEELDTTATYRVSGYGKMNNTGYIWERFLTTGTGNRKQVLHNSYNSLVTMANWTAFTVEFKPDGAAAKTINFNFEGPIEDFWLDDLSLYKLDADGNPTGDDILESIGTCDNFEAPAEITPGNHQNKTNAVRLRWTADDEHEYVAVYDMNMSIYNPVAYVPAALSYVDLENLSGGTEYSFLLKGVSADGRESEEGVVATVMPEAEPLIISDYTTSVSGKDVTVSVDIKNNGAGEDYTAQLLLCVYNGEILENVISSGTTSIPETAVNAAPVTLDETITVPDGFTMKIYLWNSLDDMMPIKSCVPYNAE